MHRFSTHFMLSPLVLAFSSTVALSLLSFHALEQPFLRLKRYFPAGR